MSSLAAAGSDAYYFPPEYDGRVHGGLSKFNTGSRGNNQAMLKGIIRFELPLDGVCVGCQAYIKRGSRFNAKKEKAGMYFTTTIWSFHMKCELCRHDFVIKTDPQNDTYSYTSGIRLKVVTDSPVQLDESREKAASGKDPISNLQRDVENRRKVLTEKERIESLIAMSDRNSKLDYDVNRALRAANRAQKRKHATLVQEGEKHGFNIPMLESTPADAAAAQQATFHQSDYNRKVKRNEAKRMVGIISQSIFSPGTASSSGGTKAAVARGREQQAMQKQAVHKIDTNNIKLISKLKSNELKKPVIVATKKVGRPQEERGDVTTDKVLHDLLGSYGDSD